MDLYARSRTQVQIDLIQRESVGLSTRFPRSALNTDALNRAPEEIRGEASGIIQTFRNFGSALGMAILGTIVLGALGPHTTPSGFADALETAFKVGAVVMAVSFVIARAFMPGGKQADSSMAAGR